MANKEIKIKSFDELQPFFQLTRMPMIHCAVQRMCLRYRHHDIVLGHTWRESCKICTIIHVSSDLAVSVAKGGSNKNNILRSN